MTLLKVEFSLVAIREALGRLESRAVLLCSWHPANLVKLRFILCPVPNILSEILYFLSFLFPPEILCFCLGDETVELAGGVPDQLLQITDKLVNKPLPVHLKQSYWSGLQLFSRCIFSVYWDELMLLKCQINSNTNKNGFLLHTKCLEGVLKYSY